MKKIMFALAAVAAFASAPAFASDFSGVHAEITAGLDDVTKAKDVTDVTYGAAVGVDFALTDKTIVGVEANVDNVFDRRAIGADARVGYEVVKNVLVYGKVGYTNIHLANIGEVDGLRYGGGVEVRVADPLYVKFEYRNSDYTHVNIGRNNFILGAGIRF